MKYYKIIQDNTFIGVVTSDNFVRYQPKTNMIIGSNERRGEFVEYKNTIYRATWMAPSTLNTEGYELAEVIEVTKEFYDEYKDIIEAIDMGDDWKEKETVAIIDPYAQIDIDFIRTNKLQEMSIACRTTIEEGFDIELRGEIKHFSLDTQDQLNLMSLGQMTQTMSLIPYHADGEACDFYASEEIEQIISVANAYKIYHTTYYNSLKAYINSLETIEDIAAITYGIDIPEEYQTDVLKALNGGN